MMMLSITDCTDERLKLESHRSQATSFSVCQTLSNFLSFSSARALSPSPSLSLRVGDVHVFHACMPTCMHTPSVSQTTHYHSMTPPIQNVPARSSSYGKRKEQRRGTRCRQPPSLPSNVRGTPVWPFVMCGGPRRQVPTD